MKEVCFCLALNEQGDDFEFIRDFEKFYEKVYKKIISLLYANPDFKISLFLDGNHLNYFKENKKEFLSALRELSAKKQVELLGGGFHNPLFPLLYLQDRSGQIEALTGEIRTLTGKRPRGADLAFSAWEDFLIPCLQNCDLEYVLLDSSSIPAQKRTFLPLILNRLSKSIKVLVFYNPFEKILQGQNAAQIVSEYINLAKSAQKKDFRDSERIVCFHFSAKQTEYLLKTNFLLDFFRIFSTPNDEIELSLPFDFIRSCKNFTNATIPAACGSEIANLGFSTIFDFLEKFPRSRALYNKMLFVGMLINQIFGDKLRKKEARDIFLEAQNVNFFVDFNEDGTKNRILRQKAYKKLCECENLIKSYEKIEEKINFFDYNGDGNAEYVFRMKNFCACVSTIGAAIFELLVMKNGINYADNSKRTLEADGIQDFCERGFFLEKLFSEKEFLEYKNAKQCSAGIFSALQFEQKKIDPKNKQVGFFASGFFSKKNQKVTLVKKISANSNGFTIQLILKNESENLLKGFLASESNFFATDFSKKQNNYEIEAISNAKKCSLKTEDRNAILNSVSYIKISDTYEKVSFVFEPNEEAIFLWNPIFYKREGTATYAASICWPLEIESGKEIEKTIIFSIIPH